MECWHWPEPSFNGFSFFSMNNSKTSLNLNYNFNFAFVSCADDFQNEAYSGNILFVRTWTLVWECYGCGVVISPLSCLF